MSVLPKEHLSKAFQSRVGDFEASNAFFTVYGSLDGPDVGGACTLASILARCRPQYDVDLPIPRAGRRRQ